MSPFIDLWNVGEGQLFGAWALYLSFETCYEVDFKHLCYLSIHKYNVSMLSHISDSVHQFSERDLIFATCKYNYVSFLKKPFSSSHILLTGVRWSQYTKFHLPAVFQR